MHSYSSTRPGPIAFAHRGGAGEAPENTLAAFEIALTLGYSYLETDAHITRDGGLVAFHDARLDRVTDRIGAIAELGIAEIEAADAGYAFSLDGGSSFPFRGRGIRVPRLQEILVRWPDVRINIDPKSDACVDPLAALLDRFGAWERGCIGSFLRPPPVPDPDARPGTGARRRDAAPGRRLRPGADSPRTRSDRHRAFRWAAHGAGLPA